MTVGNEQEYYNAQIQVQALQAQYDAEYYNRDPNQTNTWNALQQWITYRDMLAHTMNQEYASAG